MSARVTSSEVIAVMSDLPSNITDLTAFINIATVVVDDQLADSGLSDNTLKNIELYLSAHFAALKYRMPINITLGEAQDDYKNMIKTGYFQTIYGQQAISLDTTGTLKTDSMEYKGNVAVFESKRDWRNY